MCTRIVQCNAIYSHTYYVYPLFRGPFPGDVSNKTHTGGRFPGHVGRVPGVYGCFLRDVSNKTYTGGCFLVHVGRAPGVYGRFLGT